MKILEERENPFLKRKEIKAEIIHIGSPTPKKDEVIAELAKYYSIDPAQVAIDYIFTKKGTTSSMVKAKILLERPIERKPEERGESTEAQASENK